VASEGELDSMELVTIQSYLTYAVEKAALNYLGMC
jgi:hypothetical protein